MLTKTSPAAQSVKNQAAATGNEFSDLASSRKVPEHKAANDTPLTRTSASDSPALASL